MQIRPGAWRVLLAYVALVAASHVLWISFASATADAAGAFHTSEVSIGLLVSVGPICSALLSIPAGAVADRFGYRNPLLWAGLATAVFAFLRPLATDLPVLLLLTIGMLLPQPFLINAVADVVNRHFPPEDTATATGIGTMAIFLGITVGLIATPPLVDALGVRGCQVVYASFATLALVAFFLIAPRRVPDRLVAPEELSVRQALSRVLRSPTQWKLSSVLFLGFGLYLGVTTWLEEMLKPKGVGASAAGVVAGVITIAGMVGSASLGAVSDRVRRRKPFIVLAGIVAAPSLWLIGHLGSLAALIAVAAVMGFFLLAALPISIAMVGEDPTLGPQVGSTAVGVILLSGNLGGAAIVGLMGLLNSAQGGFSGAVVLEVALALAAVALALTLPETGPAALPSASSTPSADSAGSAAVES
jgi:cyanate permease